MRRPIPGPCTSAIDVELEIGGSAASVPTTEVHPLDPSAVADTIAAGFDLTAILSDLGADIEASFGSPTGTRTAIGGVDTLVAKAVPEQVEVGRTTLFNGVEQFLDYARGAGSAERGHLDHHPPRGLPRRPPTSSGAR